MSTEPRGSVLNGAFFLAEAAHELGHNYGLLHANLWRTTDGTIIGQGSNVEYGDCYDMMAACSNIGQNSHFNTRYNRLLDWLTEANVQTVTSNGEYRIYAQDTTTNDGTPRTLKINKDGTKNYWVEFRKSINGVLIRWDYASQNFRETQLLDMTPTTTTRGDEPLVIGQSFFDNENGIKITVVRKNTTPESLDVRVELNLQTTGCTYSLSSMNVYVVATGEARTTNVITRADCVWTATSNDSWITVTSGNNGTGNGTVSIAAAANPGSQRIGTVTIGGQTFSITQASGTCSDSINPTSFDVPASGGTLSYTHSCNSLTPTSVGTSDWININTNPITYKRK
jgi:hypothetical protein